MFGGKHKKFDMAEDTAEEGRNSQNFCSTELGYVLEQSLQPLLLVLKQL